MVAPSRDVLSIRTLLPPCRSQSPCCLYETASTSFESANDDEEDESKALNRKLTREFFGIGIPAFVQLAAEPLASLVDTAYLGRLGPEVLGGAGVAISAQYAVSKLYNDPLLRTSISLVASQDGKARGNEDTDQKDDNKDLSIAVSSAVLLALTVGLVQMVIYSVLTNGIIHRFGVNEISPMWHSGEFVIDSSCRRRNDATHMLTFSLLSRQLSSHPCTRNTGCHTMARSEWNLSWPWRHTDSVDLFSALYRLERHSRSYFHLYSTLWCFWSRCRNSARAVYCIGAVGVGSQPTSAN